MRDQGLAVSGGVDSMALATLYAKARTKHGIGTRCHGLIIDHKVRPGSTEEAEWIAQQLRAKCNHLPMVEPVSSLIERSRYASNHSSIDLAHGFQPFAYESLRKRSA